MDFNLRQKENIIHSEKTEILDHCGIVGMISSKDSRLFTKGLTGIQTLQTRGYDGAGFWAESQEGTVYS